MKRFISLLAIYGVFSAGVGMVAFLLEGRLTSLGKIHFLVAFILIGVFIFSNIKNILKTFGSRTARFGALVSVYVFIVIGVVFVVNVVGALTSLQIADLTESGLFTLAPQTRKVLDSLDEPLNMYAFYNGGRAGMESVRQVDRLLRTFAGYNRKVKLEAVDPFIDPLRAEKYGVTQNGTLILEYKGKTSKINTITEENITNALIRMLDDRQKIACFITNHGEYPIEGNPANEINGLALLKKLLERKDYQVRAIDLSAMSEAPADCTVILSVGPKLPFSGGELVLLDEFLQLGGRTFFGVDAGVQSNLEPLLARWGIILANDVVMEKVVEGELGGTGGFKPTTVKASLSLTVTDYKRNYPITQDLTHIHPTQFLGVRSVAPAQLTTPELKVVPLLWSKKDSWAETDVKTAMELGEALMEPDKGDKAGPVAISAVSSLIVPGGYSRQARMAVIGNAQWLTNRFLNEANNYNSDLILNMLGWLAGLEQYVGIAPKASEAKHLFLRREQSRQIFNFTVIFIPELLLLIGAGVWWMRR